MKELLEWTLLLCAVGTIYLFGWHTEILGRMQQILLSTRLIEANRVETAQPADLSLKIADANGSVFSLESRKGEVIFINFWATWCPPCIAELPSIQQLFEKKNREVSFFMISLDKDPEKAKRFIQRKGYTFPIYFPASQIPITFPIDAIPTTYLIDKEGMIQVKHEGMANYNTEDFKSIIEALSKAK